MYWIGYTTGYRKGSDKFARAALTLHERLRQLHPEGAVAIEPHERKRDFVAAMRRIERAGVRLDELHWIGHSGMYGLMFGSTRWPEQLSPHEWRTLSIPFAPGACAYFHACRTARWFAPFFARTFGVRAYGYQGYTSLSLRPDRFRFEGYRCGSGPLYVVSVPGRKTHGLAGSLRKYALGPRAEPMLAFDPEPAADGGYDAVADPYDRAFSDVRVRRVEWSWLSKRVANCGSAPRMLDLGCGNGSLLVALADRIASGVGVDSSRRMLEHAERRSAGYSNLSYRAIHGPHLPFPDASFDLVTSFLSFRYLDWDPMMREIRRVLAPGGRILIVDMVEAPLDLRDAAQLACSSLRHLLRGFRDRRFAQNVDALTATPAWRQMLVHNPIRAVHEYRWYLESRFPGRRLETLGVGRGTRLVAFDTGPLPRGSTAPLSYP